MSDKSSSAKRARRLPDAIAEYLKATAREVAPCSKLPSENQLAKQFGVSRSAVREAISGVESLGLLQIRKGAGMFVRAPIVGNLEFRVVDSSNVASAAKLLEIRTGLDAAAARIAAMRRTEEEVKFLREMNVAASQPDLTILETVEADLAFHLPMFRPPGDKYFSSFQHFSRDTV